MLVTIVSAPLSVLQEIRRSWITIAVLLVTIVFSPLIAVAHMNRTIADYWYAWCFLFSDYFFLRDNDRRLKSKLFQSLKDVPKGAKVLEIGPGTGANFEYYPNDFKLATLELNPGLSLIAGKIRDKYPNVAFTKNFIGDAENMDFIEDESHDVVIISHILCCVRNPDVAANEIFRILKKGGKLYLLECVIYDEEKEPISRFVQRMISVLWQFGSGICCKAGNIDAKAFVAGAGFDCTNLILDHNPESTFNLRRTLYGIAAKK